MSVIKKIYFIFFSVNFDAKIKVRTNVRLLDVEIEASCVCADDRHHNHGQKSQHTMSQKYVKADTVTVVANQKTVEKPAREQSPKRKSSAGRKSSPGRKKSPARKSSQKEVKAAAATVTTGDGDAKVAVAGITMTKTESSIPVYSASPKNI